MAGNLPPGVSPSDLPGYNEPARDPCDDCGAMVAEPADHAPDCPHHQGPGGPAYPDADACAVCRPPSDLRERLERGELPLCDSHTREDWNAKLDAEEQPRRER